MKTQTDKHSDYSSASVVSDIPNQSNEAGLTYRFNRKWIKRFASEAEAFDHALSYDDNFQAIVERKINGGWQTFTETSDGNGSWKTTQMVCSITNPTGFQEIDPVTREPLTR